MNQHTADQHEEFTEVTAEAAIHAAHHGSRAKCLQRLVRLGLPVPRTLALPFQTVRQITQGVMPDKAAILERFGPSPIVTVRPSVEETDWGGPGAFLNIGLNTRRHAELANTHGMEAANILYLRHIQSYAVHIARLDEELFEDQPATERGIARALEIYEEEAEMPFPQDPVRQLGDALRAMARAWNATSARLLRQAKGAPVDAGLGIIVQRMALGFGPGESGSGVIRFTSSLTGKRGSHGRYLRQSIFRDALRRAGDASFLARDPRGASLEDNAPEIFGTLQSFGETCRKGLREEMEIEFTVENGVLSVLDAVRAQRSTRAGLRIAVALAEDGIISQQDAVLRVAPHWLSELLHPQVHPEAPRDIIANGIPGSPGAATGKLVFSANAATAAAAQGDACIMVRRETSPEDIRGMQVAKGIVTERGGMTSHAAVIARGLGLPCVVGVNEIRLHSRKKMLTGPKGERFTEGDVVTIDGTTGQLLKGAVPMVDAALDASFRTLMGWADEMRDIGVRANADTLAEARVARTFKAEGIGLCRTEHMFFDDPRMTVMREMIFAQTPEGRRSALDRLLPMQRGDFIALFTELADQPITIRLLDPPLHEFLPSDRDGMLQLAEGLDLPLSDVTRRIEAMREFNPMLGLRGVRLGVTLPEIYNMQARAIFEATVEASRAAKPVVPEIMIPLVSARREVELVKTRIDGVAAAVRNETGADFAYKLGVMVETPRAALRSGEIATHSAFLSFGTNDLTQMAYGLSRDDAGRFMKTYVEQGVFPEDPFHTLDLDGVGELLLLGAERGRSVRPDISLSICGEHAGDPDTIKFCREAGFDYVSCSPYRVPVARLAAAHLALRDPRPAKGDL